MYITSPDGLPYLQTHKFNCSFYVLTFIHQSHAQSCLNFCDPNDPWDFSGKNTGVDCHFLLQEFFLTQRLNLQLLSLALEDLTAEPSETFIHNWLLKNKT